MDNPVTVNMFDMKYRSWWAFYSVCIRLSAACANCCVQAEHKLLKT